MKEAGIYCATCQRQTLHRQLGPNHVVHALLTIFTCSFWGIVWAAEATKWRPWRCTFCGTVAQDQTHSQNVPSREQQLEMAARARKWLLRVAVAVPTALVLVSAIVYVAGEYQRRDAERRYEELDRKVHASPPPR